MPPINGKKDKIELVKGGMNVTRGNDRGGLSKQATFVPVEPTISASKLVQPTVPVTVPQPQLASIPQSTTGLVSNVARDAQGFISAQSEEAAKLKELQATYGALSEQGTLSDMFQQQRQDLGIDTDMQELKDINLRLADAQTASNVTKTRIEGADGQTIGQAQREVTQEDRESAVRMAGDAARAAVLQGNIQTATQLAKDTVELAFQDRTLKATNLLNQISMLQGQVDDQTAQLLEQEKRGYEAELAQIKELKDNIATAMVSGANQSEIAQLNDPNLDDASKLALAQQITARGATQMRNLEIQKTQSALLTDEAQRANIYDQMSQRVTDRLVEQGKVDETQKAELQKALSVKSLIDSLSNDKALNSATGKSGVISTRIPGSDSYAFARTHDQLKAALSLENLTALKGLGAMSDREFATVSNSASRLDLGLSDTEYKKELKKINDTLTDTFANAVNSGIMDETEFGILIGLGEDDITQVNTLGNSLDDTTIANLYQ